jgi:hypothetical protein
VHEALGTLTVALADSPTTFARRALLEPSPENLSTDSAFAEVLVDTPITPGRRAVSDSPPDNTSAEVPTDSPSTQVSPAFSESTTESSFAEVLAEVMSLERVSVDRICRRYRSRTFTNIPR